MAIRYEKLYRSKGIKRSEHFIKSRILDASSFEFPMMSDVHWWKVEEEPYFLTPDYGYFKRAGKIVVNTPDEVKEELMDGKFSSKTFSIAAYLSDAGKLCREYKFLKPGQTMFLPDKTLLINNYGAIMGKVKFSTNPYRALNMFNSNFRHVIDSVNNLTDRRAFIILNMPETLFTIQELRRYATKLNAGMLDNFKSYRDLIFLDIWKFLDPETKSSSILSKINKSKYPMVDLVLTLDNKLVLLNLNMLASLVRDYNIETSIKPIETDMAKKYFYRLVNNLITNQALSDAQLEQLEKNIDSSGAELDSDNNQNNKPQQPMSKDEEMRERSRKLAEAFSPVKKVEATDKNQEVEEDDTSDISPINLKLTEYEIDVDESFIDKTIDDIESYVYDYTNVKDKIKNMKDNKQLTKKDVDNFEKLIEKNMGMLDPTGSGNTIAQILGREDDFSIAEEKLSITDNVVVFDKSYNKNVTNNIRASYIKNQYHDDLIRCIYSLQNNNLVIQDVKMEANEDVLDSTETYTITLKTLDKKTHTVKIILPKLKEDGTFILSGNTYTMRWQRNSLPIRKISPIRVKLTSYYGALFVDKAVYSKNDIGKYIVRKLSNLYNDGDDLKDLALVNSSLDSVRLPLDYSYFARNVRSFKYKNMKFLFTYSHRHSLIDGLTEEGLKKLEKGTLVLFGVENKAPIFMDYNSRIFKLDNNKYIELPDIFNILGIDRDNAPIEFAQMKVINKNVPIVVLLSYYFGLSNLLKVLETKTYIEKNSTRLSNKPNMYAVKFKDIILYIEKDNGIGDMILAGLIDIKEMLKEINYKTMDNKNSFNVLFNKLGLKQLHINEIISMESLYVDPITLSICKAAKLPTSFTGLLMRAATLLLTDDFKHSSDISEMTIRGYERLAGLVYTELIKALKEYNNKSAWSKASFNIKPYNILAKVNEDSTTVIFDDLNPVAALKQSEDVSYLGAQGLSKNTVNKETRVLHESEVGIISEAHKDSGDVGITAYMTANPKINSLRGTTDTVDLEKDGIASIFSTNALLMPFSINDDTKRLNFSSIQSSHIIPVKSMRVPYVRTGYEAVLPIRADSKFVITAEEAGVVTDVTDNSMTVKYAKSTKSYKIRSWTSKEESDSCYTHVMKPNLKKGDKFIKDDTLIYDSSFFEPDIFNPKRVIYKQGDVCTVALMEDSNTYEDSCSISKRINTRLQTSVTKIKSIKIKNTDSIVNLKQIGDKVEPSDTLFSITDSILESSTLDKETLEILKEMQTKSPKAKYRGVITNIEVRYNCKKESLSNSLKKIVAVTDKLLIDKDGYTGDVSNGSYSIKGKPLLDNEVEIKMYITIENNMGLGDKCIFGNQLKCTVGEVFDNNISGEDGTEVDATFSYRSISKRIVNSAILIGTTSSCLEQMTKKVLEMYFGK